MLKKFVFPRSYHDEFQPISMQVVPYLFYKKITDVGWRKSYELKPARNFRQLYIHLYRHYQAIMSRTFYKSLIVCREMTEWDLKAKYLM